MPDYLNIAGRVRTTAADGVVAEAQEVKDLQKNKSQQELNNDFSTAIEAILLLIPSAASSLNQLADKAFVNSSIATASATFRGTYNLVSDLNLTVSATHAQIGAALAGAVSDEDNNDYAFVQVPTSDATPTQIAKTERYKFNGTTWEYEYDLNNSGYTADQWAAINSGITAALVSKLSALPTNAELTTALGLLSDGIAAINGKIPSEATTSNKLVDTAAMQSYVTQIINAIDATFNVGSADGHVAVQITQVNGVITSVAVTTSDIASAAALTLVTGRVTDAEANIVSLGGRMTTAEDDIDDLQQLYNNLQQSAPVVIEPTDTWPVAVADRSATVIYRVVDRVNTPPQYYSDYMFRASDLSGQPVLMAKYDNAIDPRPKKGSQNLVTSGGVFDNMGALDVSELNATENPHTLAIYADLSAALAAIPSDYQKGGMSIKFIQGSVGSSDNKYVQYFLTKNEWSIDPNDWAIAEEGVYVENPEYVYVKADAEGKILCAIKTDGDIYYGAGCPKQVKDYIEEKILSLSLDEYEDIVAFLSDYLGSDTTLKVMLKVMIDGINAQIGTKLNAEGLDSDALGTIQAVENPEFIQAETDKDGRLLEYTTKDLKKVINKDVKVNGSIEINDTVFEDEPNIDDNLEIKLEENNRIISNRSGDGVLHENVGIVTPYLKANTVKSASLHADSINLSHEGLQELKEELEWEDVNVGDSILNVLKHAFNMPIPHLLTSNPGQADDGKEIPYELSILNVIKRANQVRYITWEQKSEIPALGTSFVQPGQKRGLPYSSCMQNDKMVGSDISIMTFMTAMNNPYSMAYTENLRDNGSVYGFTYAQPARSTVAGWCGIVCNTFVELAIGMNVQFDTGSWRYLMEIGEIIPVYPNGTQGVRIGDMLWEEGHGRLVQNVWRDENGVVTKVEVSENAQYYSTLFSAADFDADLAGRNGLIYRYTRLYENVVFKATPFDNLNDELAPTFVYNNDICTYAGDYACFREGFRIVINYDLASSSSAWTSIELYKDDVLYGTYLLSSDPGTYDRGPENYPAELAEELPDHSFDLSSLNLTYGKYKARLTDGNGNYSDYTYFEIVETDASYEFLANGDIKVSFSSSNGVPSFVRFHKENGGPKAIYALTAEDITNGYCILNMQELIKRQYNNLNSGNTYCKVYFVGDYGRVTNEPILINV